MRTHNKELRMNQEQWQHHIEQQMQSKQSIAAYCKEHNLSPKTFYNARSRYNQNPFINVSVTSEPIKPEPAPKTNIVIKCKHASIDILDASPEWLAQFVGALP